MGPLIFGIGLPSLLFVWAGDFSWKESLFFRGASLRNWLITLLMIPFAMVLSNGLGVIQFTFMPPELPAELEVLQNIITRVIDEGGLVLALIAIGLTPGITEELLCRGPLLSGLRRSLGTRSAILLSAFLFAILHMSPYRFAPQMVLGIVLAVVVLRSGSILLAMAIHAGHNGFAVILEANKDKLAELGNASQEVAADTSTVNAISSAQDITPSLGAGLIMVGIGGSVVLLLLRCLKSPTEPATATDAHPSRETDAPTH